MTRILTSLLLALVLALTSQSMAVARGSAAATGQMVLCTGNGPVAVYIDAEGQPTSAPHICPDAAFHALTDGTPPALTAPQQVIWQTFAPVMLLKRTPGRGIFLPPSRGPPLSF